MSSAAQKLALFTAVAGILGTPALMAISFYYFGSAAAANFRIHDMVSDYFVGVIVAISLLVTIIFIPIKKTHRVPLFLLWIVRCGVTLGLMLPYEAYYVLDAFGYYRYGIFINDPISFLEFGNGTENIFGIVGIISNFTESYNSIKVIFSFIGLISAYIFYLSITIILGKEKIEILYIFGLFPSLLFWTSILGKDPIVLLGISIYFYGALLLIIRRENMALIYVIIGLMIASFIRIWLGVIFLAPLIVTYVIQSRASALSKILFFFISIPIFLFSVQLFAQRFKLESTRDLVQTTELLSTAWAHGGSAQNAQVKLDSVGDMISFAPIGAFTALFRPLPFEINNAFGILAGIENAVLLLFLLLGILIRGIAWVRHPIFIWATIVLIAWGMIYGFVSYQNLGTAFRFRAQVTPFLLLLCLYLAYGNHLVPSRNARKKIGNPPRDQAQADLQEH